MTDIEYDIIDELYFVTSFKDLTTTLALSSDELCHSLQELVVLGYIKCFYPDPDTEVEYNEATFGKQCQQYYYLATKAGLMVHNSR